MKKQFFCYFNELRKNIRNFCGLLRKSLRANRKFQISFHRNF